MMFYFECCSIKGPQDPMSFHCESFVLRRTYYELESYTAKCQQE